MRGSQDRPEPGVESVIQPHPPSGVLCLEPRCQPLPITSLAATKVPQGRWGGCCFRGEETQPRSHISSVPRAFHAAISSGLLDCTSQASLSPLDGLGLSAWPSQRAATLGMYTDGQTEEGAQEGLPAEWVPCPDAQRSLTSQCTFLTPWAWDITRPSQSQLMLLSRGWWRGQGSESWGVRHKLNLMRAWA